MEGADRRSGALCVMLMGLMEDAVRHMGMFRYGLILAYTYTPRDVG